MGMVTMLYYILTASLILLNCLVFTLCNLFISISSSQSPPVVPWFNVDTWGSKRNIQCLFKWWWCWWFFLLPKNPHLPLPHPLPTIPHAQLTGFYLLLWVIRLCLILHGVLCWGWKGRLCWILIYFNFVATILSSFGGDYMKLTCWVNFFNFLRRLITGSTR